jgi:hypothetical protein
MIPILALAFYMTFLPHMDYRYPLHVDEWRAWAWSNSLINAGSISAPDPFSGGDPGCAAQG